MSTVGTITTRHEAVVAADTSRLWISGGGAQADGHASKVLPLPHMNAVLASVGYLGALTRAFHLLADLPYDDIVDAGPAFAEGFEGVVDEAQRHAASLTGLPEFWRQAVEAGEYYAILVGWSHREQQIVCFFFAAPDGPWARGLTPVVWHSLLGATSPWRAWSEATSKRLRQRETPPR